MKKVLYFDKEFKNAFGGDKNRSRYIFKALKQAFSVDFCIIEPGKIDPREEAALNLKGEGTKSPFLPHAVLGFTKNEKELVCEYIRDNCIDTLLFRTIAFSELAIYINRKLPHIEIFIDVDLLFSRLMKQAWTMAPSIKTRFYLIQWLKLAKYEAGLFKKNFTFLLANELEVLGIRNRYPDCKFEYLQNTTDLDIVPPAVGTDKQVVFFGAMDSTANIDGYNYICNKLYPLIKDSIEKENIEIIIAGKGCEKLPPSKYQQIKIIGKVDSIVEIILASRFVILPIFIASGTNTRVIEVAMCGRAVLTTPLAMEGFSEVKQLEYVVNSPNQMARLFTKMLEDEAYTKSLATQLQEKIVETYSFNNFVKKLHHILSR